MKIPALTPPPPGAGAELSAAITGLRDGPELALRPLFERADGESSAVATYFRYYGLEIPGHAHHFGTFDQGPYRLAGHVFRPSRPRGSVIALHGYLDHAGILSPLVHRLAAEDYAVALFDLPGHGLSTGERASIGDFAEFVAALDAFVALCRERLPGPYHLVGHSTGGAVILDRVLSRPTPEEDRVVLVAPLVRSYAWRLSVLGQAMAGLFVDRVSRVFRSNSSDAEFLKFVKQDPLQPRRIPFAFQRALRVWLERMASRPVSDKEVFVLQGHRDTTVDWRYNGRFLRRKLSRVTIELVDGGRHHLLNEARPLRDQVLDAIVSYLSSGRLSRAALASTSPRSPAGDGSRGRPRCRGRSGP